MALCSQAFNGSAKRSCSFASTGSSLKNNKKMCLRADSFTMSSSKKSVCIYTSSEEDNDSADEQSCYNADQVRAKRRASSRVSFSSNIELSKALAQYSDDEDLVSDMSRKNSSSAIAIANHLSSPSASVRNNSIPDTDKCSRSRCFEYLVGAIDEAWARYCDATAYVEDEVYGYNTPASVATDDEDYFENTTDITDYEDSDFEEHHHKAKPQQHSQQIKPKPSMMASSSTSSKTNEDTASCQLQALKDRLTKAKYYLQDLVDSDDYNEVISFWKRWDMIKYATIELVEDDDDDEIVENTIDELEYGRIFVN
ncbi:predicted protein [Scheffersomyces stipitis CBS 6054]|uniref:Uncharacterized protein n=1 Tax=Scheffersomyces stipitis (strain ATCC 58785 / CBS 6054 / NBRC 10063 / NRRL Y-11545) TaxID=322104 RepID=A3GHV3_PICST|nr:predicted protein [Scheffersomyces stipitis CBS 6054]EAZ62882.2 predicted protein [Scheffersomyces stipitis CBS 6054]